MKQFLIALQFLTPVPVKLNSVEPKDLSRSMRYFPVIGLLIGLFLILIKTLSFSFLGFPAIITATLLLLVLTASSGGLHLDGLSDMCDGFYSSAVRPKGVTADYTGQYSAKAELPKYAGKTKEEILKVMRDPHIGVMGVIGIVFILLIKWSVLASFPLGITDYANMTLILIPLISRWSMVVAASVGPYARVDQEGTAKPFVENVTRKDVIIATALTLIIILMCSILFSNLRGLLVVGLILLIVSLIVVLVMVMMSRKIVGGVTGDILGAINEITEITILFSAYIIYLVR